MFFNIGGGEILVIAMVALIAVGPEQLPAVLRKMGRFLAQARSVTSSLRDEFMSGLDEVNELADPDKWMGSGAADDPVVPRGYADKQRDTNAVQRRSSDPGPKTPADVESNGAVGDADDPSPVVNEIAAANAMRADDAPTPTPTVESDEGRTETEAKTEVESETDADVGDPGVDADVEAVDGGTA